MSAGAEYADRLLKQLRETLSERLAGIQDELQALEAELSSGVNRLHERLGPLRDFSFPAAETLFAEALDQAGRESANEQAALAADRERLERERGDLARERLELTHEREELNARSSESSAGDGAFDNLVRFAGDVRRHETQEEILNALLDAAAAHASLVSLLIARPAGLVVWSSRGYPEDVARRLGGSSVSASESPLLREVLDSGSARATENLSAERILTGITASAEPPLHAFPLRALRKPVAVLLASATNGGRCNPQALALVVQTTELCIENLALRVLQGMKGAPAAAESVPKETTPPAVRTVAAERPAPSPAAPAVQQTAAPPPVEPPRAVEPPRPVEAPRPVEPPRIVEAPRPVAQAVPPEEEKVHADAKRFARLLVSEIKLYNQSRVAEGRQNRDLYVRLKRDIDKSREMYERRFSRTAARKVDYFHDELIRILGENDASALGSDYPGPRAET